MKKIYYNILAVLSLLPVAAVAAVAAPFASLLEEDVDIVVSMHSLAELHAAWEGHPFAEIAENSDLQAFFAPLLEAASDDEDDNTIGFMENELGLTVDEFLEIFPGQSAVAMFNLPELAMKVEDRPSVGLWLSSPEMASVSKK